MKTFSNLQCSKDGSTISWPTPRFVSADFWEEADKQWSVRIKGWDRSINRTNIPNEASQYSLFFISPFISSCLSNSVPQRAYPSIDQVRLDEILSSRHCSPFSGFLVNFTRCAGALGSGSSSHSVLFRLMHGQLASLDQMSNTPPSPCPPPPKKTSLKLSHGESGGFYSLLPWSLFHQTADAFNRVPFRDCSPWTALSTGSLESLKGGSSAAKKTSFTSETKRENTYSTWSRARQTITIRTSVSYFSVIKTPILLLCRCASYTAMLVSNTK